MTSSVDPNIGYKPRRGRVRARRQQIDTSVPSPCVQICRLNGDTCIGCGRTTSDIRNWIIMTADEKSTVLAASAQRLASLSQERVDHPAGDTGQVA